MACKLPIHVHVTNAYSMVYFFNPLWWLARLQGERKTRCPWVTLRYESHGAAPADMADIALYPYGIDAILDYVIVKCGDGFPYLETQIRIPARQAWMGDALARIYARDSGHLVISSPFWVNGKGGSDRLAASGAAMWRPWGVPVKPKSWMGRWMNKKNAGAMATIERLRENRASVAAPAGDDKRSGYERAPRVRYRRIKDYAKKTPARSVRPAT